MKASLYFYIIMITEKQYKEALWLIEAYKKQEEQLVILKAEAQIKFPIGIFVYSARDSTVCGHVIDYTMWNGRTQLILRRNDGSKTRVLAGNAMKYENQESY